MGQVSLWGCGVMAYAQPDAIKAMGLWFKSGGQKVAPIPAGNHLSGNGRQTSPTL